MNGYGLLALRVLGQEIAGKARIRPRRSSRPPRTRFTVSGSSTTDQKAGPHAAVEVFGGPIVRVAGRRLSLSPYQAYLVGLVFGQRDGWLPRARLTELLWEEDGPDARHRLSQLLYSFTKREALSALFDADLEMVGPGSAARSLDMERFQQALTRDDLDEAADLLERGFLSDLPSVPTRAFQDWLDGRRATVRSAVRNPAANQWSRFSAEESWGSAAQAASVLLRLDPLDEGALRNVLWSRGMAGRVHEALAEYRSFRERLGARDEEGEGVRPETEEIVQRLESLQTVALPPPEIQNREPEPEPGLWGRDEELAALSRAVAGPGDSALSTVLVSGEAGMGKTRLVEEAIRGAHLRGFRVLRAGCSEFEGNIPLNPLLEALDDEHTAAAMERLEDPWYSVLLSLMPQFHTGDGPLPEVPYVDPGSLPRRTYEALRRLVVAIVNDAPLLLFLDDFQWADETSVAAVEFLRRRWSGGRLVLVLALRRRGFLEKTRGEEFADELIGAGEALHIQLEELDAAAAASLIDEVAEGGVGDETRREIVALAGRNPFFAVELTHEYLNGNFELSGHPGAFVPVPVSIRQLVEPRIEQLSEPQRLTLEALSVYGHELGLADVARLMQKASPTACAACLDRLQQLRLVRWNGMKVLVRHELIRHTVYGRLSAGTKALQHERVARWLKDSMPSSSADELALHFDRAGIRDEALEHALKAAERAEGSGAVPEAVRFLTMARKNTDDPATAAMIVGRLGHLHYLHRNFTEAAPLLDLAAERFRRLDRLPQALRSEVERLDALSRLELIPLEDFVQEAAEMKQELESSEEWESLAKLLDVEAHALDRVGDVEGVLRVLHEAEDIADRGSPEASCTAKSVLALHACYGDPSAGVRFAQSAVSLARDNKLTDHILMAVNRLTLALMVTGDFEVGGGETLCDDVESIAQRSGDLYQRFNLYGNRGLWYSDQGDYDTARKHFSRAFAILKGTPAQDALISLNMNAAECELLAGEVERAQRYFSRANELANASRLPPYVHDGIAAGVGICALHYGKIGEARDQEARMTSEPAIWCYDPFMSVLFRGRLRSVQKGAEAAAKYVREQCSKLNGHFVSSWIKLKLEEARLWRRVDSAMAQQSALEGKRVADEKAFSLRSREFKSFLPA